MPVAAFVRVLSPFPYFFPLAQGRRKHEKWRARGQPITIGAIIGKSGPCLGGFAFKVGIYVFRQFVKKVHWALCFLRELRKNLRANMVRPRDRRGVDQITRWVDGWKEDLLHFNLLSASSFSSSFPTPWHNQIFLRSFPRATKHREHVVSVSGLCGQFGISVDS